MNTQNKTKETTPLRLPLWVGILLMILLCGTVLLLGILATTILERRWESQRPSMVLKPLDTWETDNAKWGQNYPREYETWLNTKITDTQTKFGGAFPRDYLEQDPHQVILFAGYPFSKEYRQARGHYYAVEDVNKTARIKKPYNPATCYTCKSTDVPRLINQMGTEAFYGSNFHDLTAEIKNPIGCLDCHDPETTQLRFSRPALKEALAKTEQDISQTGLQQMRSLVCAQCHVEYYFSPAPKDYLVFPWTKGTTAEAMLDYYDDLEFSDYVHAISKTPIVKAQHPDYELYLTGIHAYRSVACADCHTPYRSEGGVKFTDHHVQSPLLNIANSCAVCHRWSEEEIRSRVESIQTKVAHAKQSAEEVMVKAHFDIAAAMQAGVSDEDLKAVRQLLRHAQFNWDFISASNGMGFHSPQESMRLLGLAAQQAQEVRLQTARLLAAKGISKPPIYPDISTRQKAFEAATAFVEGKNISLLP